jgi:micrococcal nuclease
VRRLCVATACAALLAGCSADDDSQSSSCGPSSAIVAKVVDGDTVVLEDGTKIRYLLVDTPETTMGHHDCYGQEAADFNSSVVLGQTVGLTYDVECKDMYGRLLAYVSIEGRELNALLIERGYGKVLHIPPDGDSKVDAYKELQTEAKAAGRGGWGYCGTDDPWW